MVLNFKIVLSLAISFLCLLFFYFPYSSLSIDFFHIDDISLIHYLDLTNSPNLIWKLIFQPHSQQFRPVASLQYYLEHFFFSYHFAFYIFYNIILVLIANLFFLLLIYKEINLLGCILSSLVLVTSKFFIYSIWNITGSFETLGVIFFLAILYNLKFNLKSIKGVYRICFLSLMLILTSERYLPFILIIPFVIIYLKNNNNFYKALKGCQLYFLSILCIYCSLRYFLQIPLLVGTQEDEIIKSFSPILFLYHFLKSWLEILGLSFGPAYLTGYDLPIFFQPFREINNVSKFFSLLSLGLTGISMIYLLKKIQEHRNIILIIFIFSFVSASSVTFRLEMRWLLPAYISLLLLFSMPSQNLHFFALSRKNNSSSLEGIFLFFIFVMNLIFNFYYALHFRKDLYFADALDSASYFRFFFKYLHSFLGV